MKIYNIIQNVLIAVIMMIVIIIGGANLIFSISPHMVLSGSMEPEIMTGSLCFIDEKDKDIKVNDIIAFKKDKMLVTHRVVDIDQDGNFITKGDNNNHADFSPVTQKELVGTNVFWIPKLGYVTAFLKSSRGIILVITCVLAFAILGGLLSRKGEKEHEKEDESENPSL